MAFTAEIAKTDFFLQSSRRASLLSSSLRDSPNFSLEGAYTSKNMNSPKLNFRQISDNQSRPCTDSQSLVERKLLKRARAGDQAAFEELCKRAEPRLLRTARNVVRNEEDARVAVQEALLNAYLNLSTFRTLELFHLGHPHSHQLFVDATEKATAVSLAAH